MKKKSVAKDSGKKVKNVKSLKGKVMGHSASDLNSKYSKTDHAVGYDGVEHHKSAKRQVQDYIEEHLQKGDSRSVIREHLLKKYAKRLVVHEILNFPDPRLFYRYKRWNGLLMSLIGVLIFLKLYSTMITINISGIFVVAVYVFFISVLLGARA